MVRERWRLTVLPVFLMKLLAVAAVVESWGVEYIVFKRLDEDQMVGCRKMEMCPKNIHRR